MNKENSATRSRRRPFLGKTNCSGEREIGAVAPRNSRERNERRLTRLIRISQITEKLSSHSHQSLN